MKMPGYQNAADRKAPFTIKAAPSLNPCFGRERTDTSGHVLYIF